MKMIFIFSVIFIILILNIFNIRICLIYNVFHIPCPGCGSTRAAIELLKGNLLSSIQYNPIPFLLVIICSIVILWNVMDYIRKKKTFKAFIQKYKKIIISLSIIITVIVWIMNLNNPLLY